MTTRELAQDEAGFHGAFRPPLFAIMPAVVAKTRTKKEDKDKDKDRRRPSKKGFAARKKKKTESEEKKGEKKHAKPPLKALLR